MDIKINPKLDLAYGTNIGVSESEKKQCLEKYTSYSILALKNYLSFENIAYTNKQAVSNNKQVLDILLPKTNQDKKLIPLYISIHGGYWQEQSHKDGSSMADFFLNKGFAFASIDYRLCPKVSLTELISDSKLALQYLLKHSNHYGFDVNQIYLIGHSAGAHLAMVLLANFSLAGGILISGIYDLAPIKLTSINQKVKLSTVEINHFSYLKLPPKLKLKNEIRVMIVYGELESAEFHQQAKKLAQYYQSFGVNVFLKGYNLLNHYNIVLEFNNEQAEFYQDCINFLPN